MEKITEQASRYQHLERMGTAELLRSMNTEDRRVPEAVGLVIPVIEHWWMPPWNACSAEVGYSTSAPAPAAASAYVDASECPPTFGVPHGLVVGLIAGGDTAIRKAVEFAEDDTEQGWKDLQEHAIGTDDTVVGIAASGGTPYVIGALERCNAEGILTGGITCNPGSALATTAQHPIVAVVGPEFVTGSTRMKSGTAQKLILNMISTSIMIKLGRVQGNRMVDMQLSNNKLVDRGTRMVMEGAGLSYEQATALLKKYGNVRKAIDAAWEGER